MLYSKKKKKPNFLWNDLYYKCVDMDKQNNYQTWISRVFFD